MNKPDICIVGSPEIVFCPNIYRITISTHKVIKDILCRDIVPICIPVVLIGVMCAGIVRSMISFTDDMNYDSSIQPRIVGHVHHGPKGVVCAEDSMSDRQLRMRSRFGIKEITCDPCPTISCEFVPVTQEPEIRGILDDSPCLRLHVISNHKLNSTTSFTRYRSNLGLYSRLGCLYCPGR